MPESNVEIRSYLEQIIVQVEDANIEVIKKMALRVQERTQMNIRANDQIDTGFMVNSVYVVLPDESSYNDAQRSAETMNVDQEGKNVDHSGDIAPEISLGHDANGAVAIAANYAIFQELLQPFFAPAAEATIAEMGGVMTKVFHDMVKDDAGKWISQGRRIV